MTRPCWRLCDPGMKELTGANPLDRGKADPKYHMLTDAGGLPLAAGLLAA